MKAQAAVGERRWSVTRWLSLIVLVLAAQVACIFGLSDHPRAPRVANTPVPVVRLAEPSWARFLELTDPSWFVLPHRQGFSGLAWMKLPEPEFHPFSYTTPAEYFRLPDEQPGLLFCEFIRTNDFSPAPPPPSLEVALTLPEPMPLPLPLARQRSALLLEGALTHRPLLTPFQLVSWTNAALLTNTVVRVVVSPGGRTQSAVLLKSSGDAEADQDALARAAVARFAPLPAGIPKAPGGANAGLAEGYMIFEWHTLAEVSSTAAGPGL